MSHGLVLVDPYNEVLAEGGAAWPRLREVAEQVGTRENLRALLAGVRAAGIQVFIAPHRRWRPGDTDRWQHPGPPHRSLSAAKLFAEGSFGGQWYPGLEPQPGDVVAYEHWGMSGFAHTDLDLQLREHGITRIVLAGMTAIGCVEGTGRYAMELGYEVTLITDATAAFTAEGLHGSHHVTGPLYADTIVSTAEYLAGLRP